MLELKRLITIVNKFGDKSSAQFLELTINSLESQLYKLVEKGEVDDDLKAIKLIYGESEPSTGFKMVKSRLKKKLYDVVDNFELNETSLKPGTNDERKCLRLINRAFVLAKVGEKALSLKVIIKALNIAKEIRSTVLLCQCYEQQYKLLHDQDNYKSFKECEKELQYYYRIRTLEQQADIIYMNARFGIKQVVAGRKEHFDKLPQAIKQLEKKWRESDSNLIFSYLHILKIQYFEFIGDYNNIIETANKVVGLIEEGKIANNTIDLRFNKYIKTFAYLQLRNYTEGIAFAQTVEDSFIYGSCNWASFMENYLLLALQSNKLDLVAEIFQKIKTSGALNIIDHTEKVHWYLYAEYYNLLIEVNQFSNKIDFEHEYNWLKYTVNDKEGFNVSIIILDTFRVLKDKEIEDKNLYHDRIRKYIVKYLNKKEAERPRLFLKLLLLMFRENFDAKACRIKGRYLLQKLHNSPLPGNAFAEIEIVPYEQLWELALKIISRTDRREINN